MTSSGNAVNGSVRRIHEDRPEETDENQLRPPTRPERGDRRGDVLGAKGHVAGP